MLQECQDLLTTLDRLTKQILQLSEGLPAEALDWRPAPETNSIAAITTHALGASRHWLVAIVGQGQSDRNRAAEFRASGNELSDLQRRAAAWLDDARRVLEPLTIADLDAPREVPSPTRPAFPDLTARGAVLHVIEHLGTHIGHLELTRQVWQNRS